MAVNSGEVVLSTHAATTYLHHQKSKSNTKSITEGKAIIMAVNSGEVVLSTQQTTVDSHVVSRPLADYEPSVWGEAFLQEISANVSPVHRDLVEQVRRDLLSAETNSLHQLQLIDSIQRLGIAHHFESEIEQALQAVFEAYDADENQVENGADMYGTALHFRLLRQQGYRVSCNVFDKFKDGEGRFTDSVASDVKGMLEFYEAAHLSIHGDDDTLDNGLALAKTLLGLQLVSPNLKDNMPLAEQVTHALKQSNRRGLPRLEARHYMSVYEQNPSHNRSLLRLAKLDFNRLQAMHKRELTGICMWWKSLDVPSKLPFARDRVVECYFWILSVYFEPQFAIGRQILTKMILLFSVMDDMYDAYGTFDELKLFTEAIERWSFECLNQLPEYMKFIYQVILEFCEEINEEMTKQGKQYRTDYAKEGIRILARAYFDEAKWREQKYMPTMKDYMSLALRSSAYRSLIITSFLGMGDIAMQEHFEWALKDRHLINPASIICRLKDDIVGHEFEKKRTHIPSAVECYMRDHNASKEETILELNKQIEAAWKNLNEGFLRPTTIPCSLVYLILNFAHVIDVVYKEKDMYTHVGPEMQGYIRQILVKPV